MANRISEMETKELQEQLEALRAIKNPSSEVVTLVETIVAELNNRKKAVVDDVLKETAKPNKASKLFGSRLLEKKPIDFNKTGDGTITEKADNAITGGLNLKKEIDAKKVDLCGKGVCAKQNEVLIGKYFKQVFDTFSVYYYVWGELNGRVYVEKVLNSDNENSITRTNSPRARFVRLASPATKDEYEVARQAVTNKIDEEQKQVRKLVNALTEYTPFPFLRLPYGLVFSPGFFF